MAPQRLAYITSMYPHFIQKKNTKGTDLKIFLNLTKAQVPNCVCHTGVGTSFLVDKARFKDVAKPGSIQRQEGGADSSSPSAGRHFDQQQVPRG